MTSSKYIIFGGTSGIGKEISLHLLKQENQIITISKRSNSSILSSKSTHISLDLSSPTNLLEDTFNKYKTFLINPKAIIYSIAEPSSSNSLIDIKDSDLSKSIRISVQALHCFLSWLIISRKDIHNSTKLNVIVLSSLSANKISPYSSAEYAISKAAQKSLCRYYSDYLQKHSLGRLNLISPSLVDTTLSQAVLGKTIISQKNPLQTKELVNVINFLLSEDSIVLSGSEIKITSNNSTNF